MPQPLLLDGVPRYKKGSFIERRGATLEAIEGLGGMGCPPALGPEVSRERSIGKQPRAENGRGHARCRDLGNLRVRALDLRWAWN